jgi:uncharacterized membrane protein YeaQ/YmgE (transglycosylase-associated protein family)
MGVRDAGHPCLDHSCSALSLPGRESDNVLGFIITMLIIGVVAGYLARLLVPGRDPMGFVQTVVLGVVGSFVGGFLGYVLFDKDLDEGALQPSGVVGAVIGAIIVLLIWNAVTSRRGVGRRI